MRGLTGLPRSSVVLLIVEIEPKRFGHPAGEVVLDLPWAPPGAEARSRCSKFATWRERWALQLFIYTMISWLSKVSILLLQGHDQTLDRMCIAGLDLSPSYLGTDLLSLNHLLVLLPIILTVTASLKWQIVVLSYLSSFLDFCSCRAALTIFTHKALFLKPPIFTLNRGQKVTQSQIFKNREQLSVSVVASMQMIRVKLA